MRKVKIKVDYAKCLNPQDCRVCLGACLPGVFNLLFYDKDCHDPKDWRILPVFPKICLNYKKSRSCNVCSTKCPQQAITINVK